MSLGLCAAAAEAQTITYTTSGVLTVVSGPDKLGLGGQLVTVTNSLQENQQPISGSTYATTISITYGGTTISNQPATVTINYIGPNSPSNNISLSGTITEFNLTIATTSKVFVPGISGPTPNPIPTTSLNSTDQLTLSGNGSETVYGFASGTIASSPGVGACGSTTVTPNPATVPGTGGQVTLNATSSPSPCTLTASSGSPWLTISPTSGLGSAPFVVTAQANTTGSDRSGSVTIGTATVTVNQGTNLVCTYTLSSTSLTFPSAGGAQGVTITANDPSCAWNASSNTSWLTVTPGSGTGTGSVNVTATANPGSSPRTGSVTIAGQTVAVSQSGAVACSYAVSPLTLLFDSSASSQTVSVTANDPSCAWTASSALPWVTVTPAGTGSGPATVTVTANTTGASRTGTIIVAGQTVSITQSATAGCSFTITPLTLAFSPDGGTIPVSLLSSSSSCAWTASAPAWVTVSTTSGTGNGTVQVTVPASSSTRVGTLVLAGQGITITQNPPPACTFSVSPTTISVDSTGGGPTVSVTASAPSCTWSVSSNVTWMTPAPFSGTGSGQFSPNVAANTSGADRTATLTVGGIPIPVTQTFTPQQFSDVPPSAYYFDAVNLLASKGITSGCAPGMFCPTTNITRAQAAVFLVRAVYGSDNFTYSPTPYFTDVPANAFGFAWIQKLYELGITTGCGTALYCPDAPITRDQMAVYLVRSRYGAATPISSNPTPYFTDVPATYWSFSWIQRLKQDLITSGCAPVLFCPANNVTRGDMAIFIMRADFNQLLPAGIPMLTQAAPNALTRGQTSTITVTGANTNFAQGVTTVTAPPGVTIGAVNVSEPWVLTVDLTVASDAPVQPQSVIVNTAGEQAVLPNSLSVQ